MRNLPVVTRYLLIANLFVFILSAVLEKYGIRLWEYCGLFYTGLPQFHFWQPFTYMFLHANFWHLFMNMFAVWMFGPAIEHEFGTRRFLTFYLICGLGAALVQELVWLATGTGAVTIGASGAVFGILFAFGWLFPNLPMFLLFIPIPIRARVFVLLYAGFELWQGLQDIHGSGGDNVAHFAHLGGFIFGWFLILYWKHINWREPDFGGMWEKCKSLFRRRHKRLDSAKKSDFDNYHYHKRV
jgi:membrane associated rhomboid family serine protease